jgi:hypothetical protein
LSLEITSATRITARHLLLHHLTIISRITQIKHRGELRVARLYQDVDFVIRLDTDGRVSGNGIHASIGCILKIQHLLGTATTYRKQSKRGKQASLKKSFHSHILIKFIFAKKGAKEQK